MPMRYLCVPMRRYLIILPTGKMTPARAERDSLVAFFFPPLADILTQDTQDTHDMLVFNHITQIVFDTIYRHRIMGCLLPDLVQTSWSE